VKFELRLIMCLLCKYIGARKRVKVTKRTQANQVSILLTGQKMLCFSV
jgi:hypothetical protein